MAPDPPKPNDATHRTQRTRAHTGEGRNIKWFIPGWFPHRNAINNLDLGSSHWIFKVKGESKLEKCTLSVKLTLFSTPPHPPTSKRQNGGQLLYDQGEWFSIFFLFQKIRVKIWISKRQCFYSPTHKTSVWRLAYTFRTLTHPLVILDASRA